MDNHTQINGITPPNEDSRHNTHQSSEHFPDFNKKLYKAIFPWTSRYKEDGDKTSLFDDSSLLIDTVLGQVELLRDLGNKISGNEDIDGFGLVGFADGLIRQLRVLDVVQGEYYRQVGQQKNQQQKIISECERVMHEDATKIAELERTIAMMKGGVL